MKIAYVIVFLVFLTINSAKAQRSNLIDIQNDRKTADSLRRLLPRLNNQKEKVLIYQQLCWNYRCTNLDTAYHYANIGIRLAKEINFMEAVVDITRLKGIASLNFMHRNAALDLTSEALELAKKIRYQPGEAFCYDRFGIMHYYNKNYADAQSYFLKANKLFKQIHHPEGEGYSFSHLNWLYSQIGRHEEALYFGYQALEARRAQRNEYGVATAFVDLGLAYKAKGDYNMAIKSFKEALTISKRISSHQNIAEEEQHLAETYYLKGDYDSALYHGNIGYNLSVSNQNTRQVADAAKTLSLVYAFKKDFTKAWTYGEAHHAITDSLYNDEVRRKVMEQEIGYEYAKEKQEFTDRQNTIRWVLSAVLVMVSIIAAVIYVSRRRKLKDNRLLVMQNKEIENQKQILKAQTLQLEQSNKMKSKLFSIISHDLKTPFASTGMVFKLLEEGILSEDEFKQFLPRVSKQFEDTSGLVDGLLVWAKSQMEGHTLMPENIDINTICKRQIELYKMQTQEKGISVFCSITEGTQVVADRAMIEIVLRNLLNNAIKYCAQDDMVFITAEPKGEEILLSVKDTGVGIPAEKLAFLFSGTITSTTGTAQETGTGLGLMLCRDLVEKNNGKIWVESLMGKETTIRFTLPAATKINNTFLGEQLFEFAN